MDLAGETGDLPGRPFPVDDAPRRSLVQCDAAALSVSLALVASLEATAVLTAFTAVLARVLWAMFLILLTLFCRALLGLTYGPPNFHLLLRLWDTESGKQEYIDNIRNTVKLNSESREGRFCVGDSEGVSSEKGSVSRAAALVGFFYSPEPHPGPGPGHGRGRIFWLGHGCGRLLRGLS